MKLKRTFICMVSAFFLMLSVCGFAVNAAEPLATISNTGAVTINGTTEESPGTNVMFMIIRPERDETSLNNLTTANEAVEDIYQGEVQADGTFAYSYQLTADAKSGYYLISVKVSGENQKRTQSVLFQNTKKLKEAVDLINGGTTSVADVIAVYKDDIDYDTGVLYAGATAEQKSYVTASVKATVTEATLVSQFKEYTGIALTLLNNAAIEKGDIKNAIENQHEKIGLTTEEYTKYTALSDSEKEIAVAYMVDNYGNTQTMSAFISLYNQGVTSAQNSTVTGTLPTPGVGGGSGGSSGSFVMTPVTDGKYELEPPASGISFDDIEQAAWAKDAIHKLAELQIVNGKADRIFAPNDNITREEFVSIVVRAFELTKASKDITFTDVSADAWYYNAVKTAYNCEIITGLDDTTFGVGERITRQDMAVIISRAVDFCNMELYTVHMDKELNDMDAIPDYATSAVKKMVKAGVINGYEDGAFKPQNQATRAQAVQIIYNILYK